VFKYFIQVVTKGFLHHLKNKELHLEAALFKSPSDVSFNNFDIRIQVRDMENFEGFSFPELIVTDDPHTMMLEREKLRITLEQRDLPTDLTLAVFTSLRLNKENSITLLPNHLGTSKEDNVNTRFVAQFVEVQKEGQFELTTIHLTDPLEIHLPYLETVNISNPQCVMLDLGEAPGALDWKWDNDTRHCHVISNTSKAVWCGCSTPGFYVALTDMYDIHWDKGEQKNPLVEVWGVKENIFNA
jgi:hypothetical protein